MKEPYICFHRFETNGNPLHTGFLMTLKLSLFNPLNMILNTYLKSCCAATLLLLASYQIQAASAVAVNKTTGAYGFAYGMKTADEAKKAALAECDGTCEILSVSDKDGHGAVLRNVNNWNESGKTVDVQALFSKKDPVATRQPGTGDFAEYLILDIWYDNSKSTTEENYKGQGGRRAPQDLVPTGENQRSSYIRDLKILDGREIRHGFARRYQDNEKREGLLSQYEFYNDLSDGAGYKWKLADGEDPFLEYEWMFKDGWRHGYSRKYGPLAIREYQEFQNDKKHGWMYKYTLQGKLEEVGHWKNDKKHGPWKAYEYKTGNLKYTGQYKNGKKEGVWITYDYKTGAERKRQTYNKGVLMN